MTAAWPPASASRRSHAWVLPIAVIAVVVLLAVVVIPDPDRPASAVPAAPSSGDVVRIAGSAPQTFDPALAGDVGTAAVVAQVFEGLAAFGPDLSVQPALARAWQLSPDGMRLTFELRPGIAYSDGTPILAQDVVDSWLHLLDPATRAPLASLLDDVEGAAAYRRGTGSRDSVGIRAAGDSVEVRFRHPASYFLSIAASPSLAVVPPSMRDALASNQLPTHLVVSGGYTVASVASSRLTLTANRRYWAGEPAIRTIEVVTDLGGRSPVDVFANGEIDYVGIASYDAPWIRYEAALGPQLREIRDLSVEYYGFDTSRPPFSDVRIRQAFAWAVDWRRLARLAGGSVEPATSIVPVGIPGRGTEDYLPRYDPAAARAALDAAGYPGGHGFPVVTLVTSGSQYDEAIATEIHAELGIDLRLETTLFDEYVTRLDRETPAFWSLSWIADYPAPEDFLGLLLGTGSSSNFGRWSNEAFDQAIEAAGRSVVPADQAVQYDRAQSIVRDEAPIVPVGYGSSWALSRKGLLGAVDPGLGLIRFAGLSWAAR
jgi:oligopeptide transport system substrate-binding protein